MCESSADRGWAESRITFQQANRTASSYGLATSYQNQLSFLRSKRTATGATLLVRVVTYGDISSETHLRVSRKASVPEQASERTLGRKLLMSRVFSAPKKRLLLRNAVRSWNPLGCIIGDSEKWTRRQPADPLAGHVSSHNLAHCLGKNLIRPAQQRNRCYRLQIVMPRFTWTVITDV